MAINSAASATTNAITVRVIDVRNVNIVFSLLVSEGTTIGV